MSKFDHSVVSPSSAEDSGATSRETLDRMGAHEFPDAAARELVYPLENLLRAAGAEALWVPTEIEEDGYWNIGWDETDGRWCIAAVRVGAVEDDRVLEGPMPFVDVRPGARVRLQGELLALMRAIGERLTLATVRAIARNAPR